MESATFFRFLVRSQRLEDCGSLSNDVELELTFLLDLKGKVDEGEEILFEAPAINVID